MSNTPKLEIEITRIKPGKYRVHRSDGEQYLILRSFYKPVEWIIERRSDCKIDTCKTLAGCKRELISGRYI